MLSTDQYAEIVATQLLPQASSNVSFQFDFPRLPEEVKLYCLRFMLRATDGIIANAWCSNKEGIYQYIRPALLAASSEIHADGAKILYGHSAFSIYQTRFEQAQNQLV